MEAFESYLHLNQANQVGHLNTQGSYLEVVQEVVWSLLLRVGPSIVHQLLKRTIIDFRGKLAIPIEERKTCWTTYSKVNMWFNQWEKYLVDLLDFAQLLNGSELGRLINIDETALSLDGANGCCAGGRLRVEFYNSSMPVSHRRKFKSSMTITLITGSSAAGEAIAPHFQFPTKAKPGGNEKLKINILLKMKTADGLFGEVKVTQFPTIYRMNEKGGINKIEFERYVEDNFRLLTYLGRE